MELVIAWQQVVTRIDGEMLVEVECDSGPQTEMWRPARNNPSIAAPHSHIRRLSTDLEAADAGIWRVSSSGRAHVILAEDKRHEEKNGDKNNETTPAFGPVRAFNRR
jgi:hypothetical protein